MTSESLFRVWPYVAVGVLALGLAIRYLRALPRMDAVMQDVYDGWASFGSSKLLRLALGALALGHLVAFISPGTILAWNGSADRLYILEGAGLLIGGVALIGWVRLVWRHLASRHPSKLCDFGDSIFVSLVLVGLVSGLWTALFSRWSSAWSAVTVSPYVASLLSERPATGYIMHLPFTMQLHVFSGFAALAVFPFTRLAPFPVLVLHRVFMTVARPLAGAGKLAEGWLRRHNPAALIWPKED